MWCVCVCNCACVCVRACVCVTKLPNSPSTAELLATTGQTSMTDLRQRRVRWLGHAARKPNEFTVKQLLFAHSRATLGPWGARLPDLMWMDTDSV